MFKYMYGMHLLWVLVLPSPSNNYPQKMYLFFVTLICPEIHYAQYIW